MAFWPKWQVSIFLARKNVQSELDFCIAECKLLTVGIVGTLIIHSLEYVRFENKD